MKHLRFVFLGLAALCALAASSCMLPVSTGLHLPFGPSGTASTTIEVRDSRVVLRLEGSIRVDDGSLRMRLTPPHGGDEIDRSYPAAVTVHRVDDTFASPAEGTWTLRVDADPSGSGRYDLDLGY